uniref:Gypsy retrotransposon integrase-like protein 1 n=1 Tax=Salarias fasciatus TaxID=181472 RepID=A0A672HB92_SALFA
MRKEIPEVGLLLREWNRLELLDGVLYRKRQDGAQTSHQLVLPEELRPLFLKSLHDDIGHMGVERTLDLIRTRFYWPKMSADVENKIKTCNRCIRRKSLPEKAAPLCNISATRPLELVCMDFLTLEPDSSNTITDHFTKYAVAIPTPNQKARTVAKCLWDHFLVHYGIPERLHSDQGPDFESRTIKELCELIGTKKIRTTPYHPRGNPVERFNRTLLNMLGTLENQKKSHWRDFVKPLVHAYNCTKNDVTGFTPYELMFGRKPRLPVDLAFGLPVNHQPVSHSQYVQNLKSHLETSYQVAAENAKKMGDRNKSRFDKHVVESTLKEGDRVLVRNVQLRGKHKLADRWESGVYKVLKQCGDLPVYTVKPETGEGPQRTLHRDLLLPCGFLPVTPLEAET